MVCSWRALFPERFLGGFLNRIRLYAARIMFLGMGGYVCEALVRSGVGAIDLIDDDKVCLTNLNRQIIATSNVRLAGSVSNGRGDVIRFLHGVFLTFCRRSGLFFHSDAICAAQI